MTASRYTALAAILLLATSPARAVGAWTQLKLGMTAVEAVGTVGEPLLRSTGQGFQVWTYDDRAELVFYGPLVGWTAPRTGLVPVRSLDVWQSKPGSVATQYTLPRPPPPDKPAAPRTEAVQTYSFPAYRRRY